jgi:hypothetical protein
MRGPKDGTACHRARSRPQAPHPGGTDSTKPRASARCWRACCRASFGAKGRAIEASAPLCQSLPTSSRDFQPNQLLSLVSAVDLREPAIGQAGNDLGGDSVCAHHRHGAAVWKAGQQRKRPTMVAGRHFSHCPLRLDLPPHRWRRRLLQDRADVEAADLGRQGVRRKGLDWPAVNAGLLTARARPAARRWP